MHGPMNIKNCIGCSSRLGVSLEGNRQNMFHIGHTNHLHGAETMYINSMKTSTLAVPL